MSEPDEGHRFKDLWAWADDDDDSHVVNPIDPDLVVAVMVVRDASAWLPEQLSALASLEDRPGRIVAVDAASEDTSGALLKAAETNGVLDRVITVERDLGFAGALAAGLDGTEGEWIWILHDDSAPEPDALRELSLTAASADVVVPKLLDPRRRNYPDIIQECGQSISRGGHRVGSPDEGDVDQRQMEAGAILGGSTAGMLVRRETWDELGGLAPELPGHRDGVDFGWRANLAGWRVVTAPKAALVHRRAGRRQERPSDHHPHFDDRLAALRIVSARGANGLALTLASWARALGFLLVKSPGHAAAELRAHRRHLFTRSETEALAARIPEGDPKEIEDLLAPKHWVVRNAFDRFGSAVMDRYRDFTSDTTLDDLTSDEFSARQAEARPLVAPSVLLVIGFLLAGVGAVWRLWGSADLAGGGLLPAPSGLTEAWGAYLAEGQPALGVAATASTLVFGQPRILSFGLILLGPLLAALAVHSLLRHAGFRPGLRAVGAALWGAAVFALGLPSAGDVSGLVVAIVGPLIVKSVLRMATDTSTGAERLRAPAVGAFWLAIGASFWPALLVLATVGAVVGAIAQRRVAPWATLVVPPWLLFLPWLGELFRTPGRWLTGVDPLAWPNFPPSGYGLLAGRIVPSGVPVWLSVGFFVVLALLAVWGLPYVFEAAGRWVVAFAIAVPLVAGAGLSRLAITLDGGQTRALLTTWALLVVGGMIAAIVLSEEPDDPAEDEHRGLNATVIGGALAAVVLCAWPFVGMQGPVGTGQPAVVGYVRDVVDSPRDSRALLIEKTDDVLTWNVVDRTRPQWGSGEHYPPGAFAGEFEELVQTFAGGTMPDDLSERLQRLAVSHVWLSGFTADEMLGVGNAAGLSGAPASESSTIFTVTGLVSRANVVAPDGTITPVVGGAIPAGDGARTLTISDDPEADLQVRVGGRTLERIDGELPTYDLGDASGTLEYGPVQDRFALWWSVAIVALLGLLALPTMSQGSGTRQAVRSAR